MLDESKKDAVWDKAKKIRGENPSEYRQDPYGNKMKRDDYGESTKTGWVIDHIKPESLGGSDSIRNLQAMNTKKNSELKDSLVKRSRHNQR